MSKKSLVSVIIPTYKRNELIEKAIQSVIGQTYPNIEIIVVDDNDPRSSYRLETKNKILELKKLYSNIKYIEHDKNKGGSAARNTGVSVAQGEHIAFLDDDDWWISEKIKKQLDFIGSNSGIVSESVNIRPVLKQNKILTKKMLATHKWPRGTTSSFLVKKDIFIKYGFDENLPCGQEFDLFLQMVKNNENICCIKDKLVFINTEERYERITNIKKRLSKADALARCSAVKKNKNFLGQYYKELLARNILSYFHKRENPLDMVVVSIKQAGWYSTSLVLFKKILKKVKIF